MKSRFRNRLVTYARNNYPKGVVNSHLNGGCEPRLDLINPSHSVVSRFAGPSGTTESAPRLLSSARKGVKP